MLFLFATAWAGPFQTLHSSATLPSQQGEMGGAVGYIAPTPNLGAGSVLCSGWARYGLGDRTEAFGGAIGGTGGYGFAVHGGARYRLGATDGPQLSAGIGAYTAFRRIAPVGFTVPVMVGWAGDVDVFLGGSLLVIPVTTAGSLLVVQGEAGTRFDVESFPVYIAATYQGTSGFHAIGLSVGVGYNTAQ